MINIVYNSITGEKYSLKETECVICEETFFQDWVRCLECDEQAHKNCADNDSVAFFSLR